MRENYENLDEILSKIKYRDHGWVVCGDLKVLSLLLGQQGGYVKYPCFLCEWDSRNRAEHYVKRDWPVRNALTPGVKNVVRHTLVDPSRVLLPPLHIKLGLMKQFVKALPKDGECFKYLCKKFPGLSEAKLKEGIFVGPEIRKVMNDSIFETTMNHTQAEAWNAFKDVVINFLGNNKSPNYENIVRNMVNKYKELGCLMNLKLHFLDSHLSYFPDNLGAVSEEQGERFHQDIKEMERRYQGRWNVNMIADYCWMLKREEQRQIHKRKTTKRSFHGQRKRYHKDL